ncbi:MAG: hypothetical protein LBM71_05365 [Elusimicrobiota bacterium]|nr:hypothetical protein [Elusimicrobiota bacterium]
MKKFILTILAFALLTPVFAITLNEVKQDATLNKKFEASLKTAYQKAKNTPKTPTWQNNWKAYTVKLRSEVIEYLTLRVKKFPCIYSDIPSIYNGKYSANTKWILHDFEAALLRKYIYETDEKFFIMHLSAVLLNSEEGMRWETVKRLEQEVDSYITSTDPNLPAKLFANKHHRAKMLVLLNRFIKLNRNLRKVKDYSYCFEVDTFIEKNNMRRIYSIYPEDYLN